jgi:hypothetical protein
VRPLTSSRMLGAWATVPILAVLHGCIRTGPKPVAWYWVASDSSQYSPAVRFRVTSAVLDSGVQVLIHGGTITLPGVLTADAPPLMSHLHVTALLAALEVAGTTRVSAGRSADFRGWRPIAMSDSVLVAEELRYGEQREVGVTRLWIPVQRSLTHEAPWLVLRITGNTVELRPPPGPGMPPIRRDLRGGVRVYACGDYTITGLLDRARVRSLREAYGVAC